MPLLSSATLAMWWNIADPDRQEFEHWHSSEHLPERLGVPGFRRGTRWSAASGEGSYFVVYEIESLELLDSQAYVDRVNSPTPWSSKVMKGFRNMVRSRCRVSASHGGGIGGAVATVRFSPQPGREEALREWLGLDLLPGVATLPGLACAHLLENVAPPVESRTAEEKLRGGDAMVDWAVLVGGYSSTAVASFAQARLGEQELMKRGATAGVAVGHYTLQHSATGGDFLA